jgi:hypothetical protein
MELPLNNYRIGPLLYVTDLLLPELPPGRPEEDERAVSIRMGEVPPALSAPLATEESYEANDTEFLLRLPGVATYYVRDGVEVIVDPEAGAPELDVRSYLMGNLFAVLCHQRGLLPLHASAIATPRCAVAFLGASGAGKSSIAAFLARRGHRILADDICLVDPAAPHDRRMLPVAPWLKLWSATLDAMGESSRGLSRIFTDDEKYRYTLEEPRPRLLRSSFCWSVRRARLRRASNGSHQCTRCTPCLTSRTSPGWYGLLAERNNTFCAADRLWMGCA